MGKLVFLVGIPYAGKTTLGKRVAELMHNLPFYDIDDMAQAKLSEVLLSKAMNPLERMRYLEGAQLSAFFEFININGPAIVATAAEIALVPECVEIMKNTGHIILLKRDIDIILSELRNSDYTGPVLKEVDTGTIWDIREKTALAYADELPRYEAVADLTLDNNGSEHDGVVLLRTHIETIIKGEPPCAVC